MAPSQRSLGPTTVGSRSPVRWFVTVIALCTISAILADPTHVMSLKLGLISPSYGDLGFERVAAASTMGIRQAKKDGFLKGVDVSFIWRNSDCNGKAALGMAVTLQEDENVDAYIGIPCSEAAMNAGKIIAFWDLPHISYSSADHRLANKVVYNTLIRLMTPYNIMAKAIVQLFKHYSWGKAIIISSRQVNFDQRCEYVESSLLEEFDESDITLISVLHPKLNQISSTLETIKRQGRISVICGDNSFLRAFMLAAHEKKMTDGEYVFLSGSLLPDDDMKLRWKTGQATDDMAGEAFKSLLQLSLSFTLTAEAKAFQEELPKQMTLPPWNYNRTYETGQKGSPYSLYLHDASYLYAMCADEMIRNGYSPRNGTMMMALSKTKQFIGKSGVVQIDTNGDRVADYAVWHLNPTKNEYTQMANIKMTALIESNSQVIVNSIEKHAWGKYGYQPPHDTPECGFFNELCKENKTTQTILIVAVVAVVILVICGVVVIVVILYRRNQYQFQLDNLLWQVKHEDIEFLDDRESFPRSMAKSISSGGVPSDSDDILNPLVTTRVGMYRGAYVAVNKLVKSSIVLTRQDRIELKILLDFKMHENINTFIGLCLNGEDNYVLTSYCSKGSLKDVLQSTDVTIDANFKNSLISDLIQGIAFIHQSEMKSHGRLKSANCVIDGRWLLRITDLGLTRLREHVYEKEEDRYKAMLWTAPELLQGSMKMNGTPPGDIYSFSIILYEIIFRCCPYQLDEDTAIVAKDIIGRVRNGESTPFRPPLPPNLTENLQLIQLMKDCWAEDPLTRPDYRLIKKRFSSINDGKRYNIVDNTLRMLEKYANDLELVITERTKQLTEEKIKTDMLLYRMIPPTIANALKVGRNIPPELFRDVSVYFSDIVSFTAMSSQATPMQVVEFLNELWTLFDEVIEKHDVYKVETIGDAYMVCSGLPIPNEKGHASEIANMALEMLSELLGFKAGPGPYQQVQIRIGIHSGPVVAGVVGRTMPRYCLFGDTVNTASCMENLGSPSRIHITKQTVDALNKSRYKFIIHERGTVQLKGKGKGTVQTFWLNGREGYQKPLPTITD